MTVSRAFHFALLSCLAVAALGWPEAAYSKEKKPAKPPLMSSPEPLHVDPSGRKTGSHATIQAAADAAKPGDVIEIAGGVYYERIDVRNSGTREQPITIRSAPNQIVVINAGRPLEVALKPAPGLPEVYAGAVGPGLIDEKTGLWEMPSRLRLTRVHTPEQAARRFASWHYDAERGLLYIRSSGILPADRAAFWLEAPEQPAVTASGSHLHFRHLRATLGKHGFLLTKKGTDATVEDCKAYCNSGGGIHATGTGHRIIHNETFQNNTYGIQLRHGVHRVHVLNNLCYLNGPNNGESTDTSVPTDLGIYSQGQYNLVEGNVIDGAHKYAYRNKYGANPTNIFRNNVVRGHLKTGPYGVYDNTLIVSGLGMRAGMYMNGGEPSPLRSWDHVDAAGIQRASNLIYPLVQKEEPSFADPAYRDFRLQSDSPYFGRGAFPGRAAVWYVDPVNGSDENSGLSLKEAFATPARALSLASAGSTLYLMPARYEAPFVVETGGLDGHQPLKIRAHGKSAGVVVSGGLRIAGAQFVEIDGLEFDSCRAEAVDSPGLVIRNAVFKGAASGISVSGSEEAQVDHCTFENADAPLRLEQSPRAALTQSLLVGCATVLEADAESAGRFFSDFNAYSTFVAVVGGRKEAGLAAWKAQSGNDLHSEEGPIALAPGAILPGNSPLVSKAADFGFLGARNESPKSQLGIEHLQAAGLSPRGATLLWDSPRQASFSEITLKTKSGETIRSWEPAFIFQIMGEYFDMTMVSAAFFSSQRHAVVSGLEPGVDYVAVVVSRDLAGNRSEPATVEFRTPAAYAGPVTYYLSPKGDDRADGKSKERPWGSFAHALSRVAPGDEVILLSGTYHEILRPRVAGTADRKIKIRAEKPLEAVLDLGGKLPVAVEIVNTDHLEIDGLLITGGAASGGQCYVLDHAEGITIRNCETDYPAVSNFGKLKLGHSGLVANRTPNLLVENNLFLCGTAAVALSHAPGAVVRQNTIVGEGNYGVVLVPGSEEERYTIEGNLFYRTVMGYKTGPCIWVFDPMPQLVSDYNLFHIPAEHKGTIGKLPSTERLVPLQVWQTQTGLDQNSLEATPVFANPQARDFALQAGSPGKGSARDKGDIGRRK